MLTFKLPYPYWALKGYLETLKEKPEEPMSPSGLRGLVASQGIRIGYGPPQGGSMGSAKAMTWGSKASSVLMAIRMSIRSRRFMFPSSFL